MTVTKDDGTVEAPRPTKVIAIDAGHGGGAAGVVVGELVEKAWTLEVAKMLEAALLEVPGVVPVMMRDTDETLPNSERGDLAQELGADLVVSLHVNSNEDPSCNGMWAYHWPGNKTGEKVGTAIEREAPPEVRPRTAASSEAKQESWPRVRNVIGVYRCTAVLVECGFATNPDDNRELRREDVKRGIVAACVAGVVAFLLG